MAAGDLDGDGAPEVVLGMIKSNGLIFWNAGDGSEFHRTAFGDGQGGAYAIAIGDLDGDGRPDIAVARSGAPSVVYFNRPAR